MLGEVLKEPIDVKGEGEGGARQTLAPVWQVVKSTCDEIPSQGNLSLSQKELGLHIKKQSKTCSLPPKELPNY